ncbi:hypothetical protein DAEQUDRAFT_211782 [Daedalea quercina L-15889]|uniref:C2H2-type domain-containing protein n=1 Tax=Daedalea quercina L-15889 TaxID=1314783 RepID=A0A165RB59_9APHY|nr:hypothetical protein DAEQUDRAFT_211782 [Daedalea quercina L-15889]
MHSLPPVNPPSRTVNPPPSAMDPRRSHRSTRTTLRFHPYLSQAGGVSHPSRLQSIDLPAHGFCTGEYSRVRYSNFTYRGQQDTHSGSHAPGSSFTPTSVFVPAADPLSPAQYENASTHNYGRTVPNLNSITVRNAASSPEDHAYTAYIYHGAQAPFSENHNGGTFVSEDLQWDFDRSNHARISMPIYPYNDYRPTGSEAGHRWDPFSSSSTSNSNQYERQSHFGPEYSPVQEYGLMDPRHEVVTPAQPYAQRICRWEGCGALLENVSVSGVKLHLKRHHHINQRVAAGRCEWHVDSKGGVCGRPLDSNSYPKHIASVHLKSTAVQCLDCGRMIGRVDSLTRHLRDHCRAKQDQMAGEILA